MTNNSKVSLDRELLKDLADYGDKGKVAEPYMVEKLRAILDKPVTELANKRCSCKAGRMGRMFWSKIHQRHVSCELHANPSANPQCDPVAIGDDHLLAKVEGLCDLAIGAIEDDERRAFFEKRLRDFKDEAALTLVAKNQVDPVAWVTQCHITGLIEQAEPNEKATNIQCWTDAFPVYREQPAPVAVVMPERKSVDEPEDYNTNIGEVAFAEGYNDALDDVARLNGVKP